MMNRRGTPFVVPVMIIVVGAGWLLNTWKPIAGIDWLWTLGLGAAGVLALTIGGINRLSCVIGPFLLAASVCSVLRQTGHLSVDWEVPILTIVLGLLMLLVQLLRLPLPGVLTPDKASGDDAS